MKECHIEISDRVTPEITSCIAEGLDRFNDQQIGYGDRLPLAVVVKDPDSGDVLGNYRAFIIRAAVSRSLLSAGSAARHGAGQRTVAPFRTGRPPARLPFRRLVHHQLSGAGILSTAWLATHGRSALLAAGD